MIYIDKNFSQAKMHTPIFEGEENLTFIRCNLKNCDIPQDSITEDCLICHEDIIELVEEDVELTSKKQEIEQQVMEDYRMKLKSQLVEITKIDDIPIKEDLQVVMAQQTIDATPIRIQPPIEEVP